MIEFVKKVQIKKFGILYNIFFYFFIFFWETNTHTREKEMGSNIKAHHNST